jgi:DNA polymerase III delta prime subunit
MLFRVLEDDLFRLFSGKYACAYAALLERLHGGLFSVEAIDQPTRQEVLRELGEGRPRLRRLPPIPGWWLRTPMPS